MVLWGTCVYNPLCCTVEFVSTSTQTIAYICKKVLNRYYPRMSTSQFYHPTDRPFLKSQQAETPHCTCTLPCHWKWCHCTAQYNFGFVVEGHSWYLTKNKRISKLDIILGSKNFGQRSIEHNQIHNNTHVEDLSWYCNSSIEECWFN